MSPVRTCPRRLPPSIHSSIHRINLHIRIASSFPHSLVRFPNLPIQACHISHLHLPRLLHCPPPRISNLPLHLLRLLPRQRRRFPHRLARARRGLCDFVLGEALGLLPLAFEGSRGFGLERGGGVGVGSGGHCGWLSPRRTGTSCCWEIAGEVAAQ